jgi:hypothetical protein
VLSKTLLAPSSTLCTGAELESFIVDGLSIGLSDFLHPTVTAAMERAVINNCCFFHDFLMLFGQQYLPQNFPDCIRPEPLFLPPPVALLTVAQACRSDSRTLKPRAS